MYYANQASNKSGSLARLCLAVWFFVDIDFRNVVQFVDPSIMQS